MSLKLLPAILLLLVAAAAGLGQAIQNADASVTGPLVASSTSVTDGGVVTINVPLTGGADTTEATQIQLTGVSAPMSASLTGTLVVQACDPSCPGDLGKAGTLVVVDEDNLNGITVGLRLFCNQAWTARVTAEPGEVDETHIDIACSPAASNGGGSSTTDGGSVATIPDVGQFIVYADPNILPCEGGTTTIYAEVIDTTGQVLNDFDIHFRIAAGSGTLNKTSNDTANLTLSANETSTVVTASLYINDGANSTTYEVSTPTIQLECNGTDQNQTLVVTASPNVIDCTGTTTITASVRDRNGHVISGRGYHFVTSTGLLTVNPNNAENEEATATLKLRPGDGDATVTVSSGLLYGTYEDINSVESNFVTDETGMVTVQQNCLSETTGQIRVNSSAKNIACGQNVFIGLSVIDESIQTVVDNTPLTLIATAGGFYGGEGTLLTAAQVPTSHGEANTIYTAPANFNGEVTITAASGDVYGSTKLNVSCVVTGTATSNGTGSAPACVDIGDGVCITPPNTGRTSAITPPNTGDGGLK